MLCCLPVRVRHMEARQQRPKSQTVDPMNLRTHLVLGLWIPGPWIHNQNGRHARLLYGWHWVRRHDEQELANVLFYAWERYIHVRGWERVLNPPNTEGHFISSHQNRSPSCQQQKPARDPQEGDRQTTQWQVDYIKSFHPGAGAALLFKIDHLF